MKGFRQGDVILTIGNKTVRTAADVEQGIADARKAGRESVLLLVTSRQGQGQRYVALKVGKG
jgi:serine protease Do